MSLESHHRTKLQSPASLRVLLQKHPQLADASPATDNVWDIDCSSFFPPTVSGLDIHGAYFVTDATIALMRQILRGLDRGVLEKLGVTKGNAWPV